MPEIPYHCANFSGKFGTLNKSDTHNVKWSQLIWAAITVGKAHGDGYTYGIHSVWERLQRVSMIYAYLRQNSSGFIIQTMSYQMSDPTEKAFISYSIGMTLTKLFSELLFDIPRVLHLAVYGKKYNVKFGLGKSRPDLTGLSKSKQCFVFEAKGRSSNFDTTALNVAKTQAKQIQSIENQPPVCSIACQAYFTNKLEFRMEDPPSDRNDQARAIKINRKDFEHAYIDPIRTMIKLYGANILLNYENKSFRGARIAGADLWIAVADEHQADQKKIESDHNTYDEYLGGDGVLIRLGSTWSKSNMQLQPHRRAYLNDFQN